ncbi:hypothetical protein F4808DRAFT_461787 [Astrocystis sublimbata]|nr:hypothetical protein F4808DRAFT_461787 [Astrocystis sublimbata]
MTDPHTFTGKMTLQPKSPSPLHESYFGGREGQSAAVLDAPVISPPIPPASHYTTANASENSPVWGDPRSWRSSLGSPTGHWDHHNTIIATNRRGFAAQDGEDQFAMSVPSAELMGPVIAEQSDVFNANEGHGWAGHDANTKAYGGWQAPVCHATPMSAPLVSYVNNPYVSYADGHENNLSHDQSSTALIEPFSPRRDVADCNAGFTRAGLGMPSAPLESPHVQVPRELPLPDGKEFVSEGDTLESVFKFPTTHFEAGHTSHPSQYHGRYGFRYLDTSAVWYGGQTHGLSLDVSPETYLSHDRPLHSREPMCESSSQMATNRFKRRTSHSHSVSGDKSRRHRGQLKAKDREETSKTRKRRACIRCRMQKIRVGGPIPTFPFSGTYSDTRLTTRGGEQCVPDPDKPETACCICCDKVLGLDTKKVIHRIPCLRWNLNEVVLFRVGGLGFTQRWAGVCVENIPPNDWVDERVVTIGMGVTKLFCDPIALKVRRYRPNSMDVQHRYWRFKETESPVMVRIPAYALADVDATSEEYRLYVQKNAEESVRRFVRDSLVNDIVKRTFAVAGKAANRDFGKTKGDPASLFRNYFRLWLAARFTLGSAYVAAGYEKLEASNPPCERQFVSRMVTAQFDSIGYNHVLVKLKREVLDELWLLMQKRTDTTFFTVYLIVFMMLHEVSVACQDRRRRAREQGLQTYYDLEDVTAKIKHGADIILGHWHYYKGDLDPLTNSEATMARQFGTDNLEEIQTLIATREKYAEMKKKRPGGEIDWEDPLCLVSQMFERDWRPMQSGWP